jgi:hypothetical protein
MNKKTLQTLKYPTGEFKMPKKFGEKDIEKCIKSLEAFPAKLRKEVQGLNENSLAYRHRPGGWTITQLVHHCADSSMNAFIRTKLTLTENKPAIKPYDESAWANMDDAAEAPIGSSLILLEGLYKRWITVLNSINTDDLNRTYYHPQFKKQMSLSYHLFLCAWHEEHHLAHIKQAKKHKNKFDNLMI